MDRHVGVADQRCQLVDDVTGDEALVPPVPRHADLMDHLAVDREGPQPPGDQRLGADLGAGRADAHPVEILDALVGGQLGRELDEQLRL